MLVFQFNLFLGFVSISLIFFFHTGNTVEHKHWKLKILFQRESLKLNLKTKLGYETNKGKSDSWKNHLQQVEYMQ